MKQSSYKAYEDLPLFLNVNDLSITIFLSVILSDKIIDLMYLFYEHCEIPVDAYVTVTLELIPTQLTIE